ncbi:MAG: flagellar biosynthesis protein FlhG, partial [bacterium]
GSSGVNEMSELDREQQAYLLSELSKLQSQYDYFLIDTGAGIASSVLRFNASADEICVITTVEPTAMTDAYALMKIMSTKYQVRKFNLIVNQATPTEAKNVHQRLEAVAQRYLPIEILFIGNVPKDPMLNQSIRKQVAMSVWAPNSHVTRAYEQIATQIDIHPGQAIDDTPTSSFWERVGIWKARR